MWLRCRRVAAVGGFLEELTIVNRSRRDVGTTLSLRLATDLAEIERVKAGLPSSPVEPLRTPEGVR